MEEVALAAETGRPTGSAAARRLRAAGKIPGVLYGHGVDPQSLAVDGRSLRLALSQEAGLNALLNLDVGGTQHLAMARQLQRDPVRGTVAHVDFVIVRRDEVVSAEVPVHLLGEAEQVQRADGLVEQQIFTLTVNSTPANIPAAIEVDISGLDIGDVIRVGDLPLPAGVTTDLDPEEPVVAGQASRVAAEVEAVEAEAAEAAGVPAEEVAAEGGAAEEAAAEAGAEGAGGEEAGGKQEA
ncbi:MAG TPA: 50S ribosomal protein L25 [Acidimicrobiales bacterium]|nr:50S ribosomal protein L25 [Acidimicrobiales bacterium]